MKKKVGKGLETKTREGEALGVGAELNISRCQCDDEVRK